MEKICKVEGCEDGRRLCRGLCRSHHRKWQRGDTSIVPNPPKYTYWGNACLMEGCERTGKITEGYCDSHYRQFLKHGKPISLEIATPNRPKGTLEERFWASLIKSENTEDCWEWTGYRNNRGYGTIGIKHKSKLAHRLSYDIHNGTELLSHQPVHHICANTGCVNPAHLQRVTQQENTAEMRERDYYVKEISRLKSLLKDNGIEY